MHTHPPYTTLFRVVSCGLFFLFGAQAALADDAAIESVTLSSHTPTIQSASASYSILLTPSVELSSGTELSIIMAPVSDQSDFSQFNFEAAYHLSTASSLTDGVGESVLEHTAYTITLADALGATQHSLGLGDVHNPDTGCYRLGVTTHDVATASLDDFTWTEGFAIGSSSQCSIANVTTVAIGQDIGISWEAFTGADAYRISYSTSEDGLDDAPTQTTTSDTQVILTDLEASTLYYINIEALDTNDQSLFTNDTVEFTTGAVVVTDRRATKPEVRRIRAHGARARWEHPENHAFVSEYRVQLRTRRGHLVATYTDISPDATRKRMRNLTANKHYKVRMRYVYTINDEEVATRWSRYQAFTTSAE